LNMFIETDIWFGYLRASLHRTHAYL